MSILEPAIEDLITEMMRLPPHISSRKKAAKFIGSFSDVLRRETREEDAALADQWSSARIPDGGKLALQNFAKYLRDCNREENYVQERTSE